MTSLTFIHTNDLHSNYDDWLRQATIVRERKRALQSESMKYVLLDGGDHMDMSVNECLVTTGKLNMEMLAELEYDAMSVGNNELLRSTVENIRELSLESKVPWLLANLKDQDGLQIGGTKDTLMLDLGDGIKVGLFGATDQFEDTYEVKHGFRNVDTYQSISNAVEKLKSDGATLIVFLSHLGYGADIKIASDFSNEIDVIVGAHSHTVLESPVEKDGVIIVQAGALGAYVGELQLIIDNETGRITEYHGFLHNIDNSIEQDGIQKKILREGQRKAEAYFSEVLTTLETPLSHENFVKSIAHCLRQYWGAEIGMVFGAVATDGLAAGNVSKGDIFNICRSMVRPAKLDIKGRHLLALITESQNPDIINQAMYGNGYRPAGIEVGNLHFSGLTWEVGTDAAIHDLKVNGEVLDLERQYIIGSVAHMHYPDACGYPSSANSRLLEVASSVMVKDIYCDYMKTEVFYERT